MIHVEVLGNQVLETWFPIGLFQNLKHSCHRLYSLTLTHPFTLTQTRALSFTLSLSYKPEHSRSPSTLSTSPTHSHTKNLSPTPPLTHSHSLSLTNADRRSPSHFLSITDPNPVSLTLSLSHSPTQSHASVSHPLHPHSDTLAKRIEMYQTVITELYAKCKVCFTIWLLRNNGKNQRIFGESSFFFYFGFCFKFLIELLKKIEALLFFEFGLCFWDTGFVYIWCGIRLCCWVCLGFRVLSFGFRC